MSRGNRPLVVAERTDNVQMEVGKFCVWRPKRGCRHDGELKHAGPEDGYAGPAPHVSIHAWLEETRCD